MTFSILQLLPSNQKYNNYSNMFHNNYNNRLNTMTNAVRERRVLNGFFQKVQHRFQQSGPLRDALHSCQETKILSNSPEFISYYYNYYQNVDVVPARGALAGLLCARESVSALEPEEVEGPGLLSMATSDTKETTALPTHLARNRPCRIEDASS